MLAREFIAARAVEELCGLVLVDPVQERMLFETWPDPSIAAVTAGLDYVEIDRSVPTHHVGMERAYGRGGKCQHQLSPRFFNV